MPLFGGDNGLDITEKEPFRNTRLDDNGGTAVANYAANSLFRAIDSVKDPEVLDMNLLVLPGVTHEPITKYAMDICEQRGDALAIIDLKGGYQPTSEDSSSEETRIGSVSTTISNIKARNLNTSYGCAYYPWVKVLDTESGAPMWMSPSVVALGTMASSQERSEVWFAPAGFNRGGLSLGSSGLSVVGVREKLSAKQRDALYEVNINPIASFPSEGIVIFGQKTLQATPSALDRINVRRLVIFLKKQMSILAAGLLFEPNVENTWNRFRRPATSILESVKNGFGISDYKLVLDRTTTTPEEIDRNMMYAKLFIKPVYAIEFIGIDFVITNTGASFEDL
jgi:phage tail sheath protein FI